eukprot:6110250-Prymnesium_polylepis.1
MRASSARAVCSGCLAACTPPAARLAACKRGGKRMARRPPWTCGFHGTGGEHAPCGTHPVVRLQLVDLLPIYLEPE